MIYFSLVKGLSKMAFLHLKCMHLGSVSLAFMRICKVISHYSCNQNSALESLHCVFFFFWVFLVYGYLSKESPEFSELVCFRQTSTWFLLFVLNFDFPKILCENMHSFGRKGKHAQRFLPQWFCKYKGVLSMLFAWTQKKENTWFY